MRKKIWVASPLMYVALAAMIFMTAFSDNYSSVIFYIKLGITVAFALSLAFIRLQFWFHIREALKTSRNVLIINKENKEDNEKKDQPDNSLNDFSIPVVVTGVAGDIIWTNQAFLDAVEKKESILGDGIEKYIYPKTINQIINSKGVDIEYRKKQFSVHGVKTKDSYIFYFVDDTYYKKIHYEYISKKPVVAVLSFDNKDELMRGQGSGEESRVTAEVEKIIGDWAKSADGFLRKLSSGRYMMLIDEANLSKLKVKKFEILNKVRTVKNVAELSATISIGIGAQAGSATQSEIWARKALEMALGRGGDQVVLIKNGQDYEFFGGNSQVAEKRDKVRTRVIATTLTDHIRACDKVFIMGHKNSDLDSIGSAVGIWSVATKSLKKKAFIVVNQSQSLATPVIESVQNAYKDLRVFIAGFEAEQEITEKTLLVVVDTHSDSFVENPNLLKLTKNIVVIDHHRMLVNYIKNPIIFYHEPYASSASEMVAELIQYMDNDALGAVEAQALLAGIMLDTKNFVLKTGIRTFEASAYLKRRGADTVEVKRYFATSAATYKEKSQIIADAQIYKDYAISLVETVTVDTRVAAAQAADELLSINGVKASFVLFGSDREVNISGRSLGEANVQVILEAFGGGGHLTMAGAQVKGRSIEETKADLIKVLNK